MRTLVAAYRDPTVESMTRLTEVMTYDSARFATPELAGERAENAKARPEHLANYLDGFTRGGPIAKWFRLEDLPNVQAPALLIHGRDDRVVHFESTLLLLAYLPNSRAVLLNRCGHWAQVEHAEEFNRLVIEFVPATLTASQAPPSAPAERTPTMTDVLGNITENAHVLRDEAEPSDDLGQLSDGTAEVLRDSGVIRMYQPAAVRRLRGPPGGVPGGRDDGRRRLALGGLGHRRRRRAPVGDRDDGPAPAGGDLGPRTPTPGPPRPTPRSGGRSGSTAASSSRPVALLDGTDHSDWVILGGMVVGDDGEPAMPPDMRHFVIPRADYEIIEDSWNVLGLQGTGSKDVRMPDVFVPEYRVVEAMAMSDGAYEDRQAGKPSTG